MPLITGHQFFLALLYMQQKKTGIPPDFTVLEQVKSCGSVSCLINTESFELLRLQPSKPIASESVDVVNMLCILLLPLNNTLKSNHSPKRQLNL